MPELTVSGAQIPVTGDIAGNERAILRAIEHAAETGQRPPRRWRE